MEHCRQVFVQTPGLLPPEEGGNPFDEHRLPISREAVRPLMWLGGEEDAGLPVPRPPAAPQGYRSGLFTLLHTVDVFRGMKTKRIAASGKSWRGVLCWPLKFCQPSLASCCRTRSDGQLWGWKACEQT